MIKKIQTYIECKWLETEPQNPVYYFLQWGILLFNQIEMFKVYNLYDTISFLKDSLSSLKDIIIPVNLDISH